MYLQSKLKNNFDTYGVLKKRENTIKLHYRHFFDTVSLFFTLRRFFQVVTRLSSPRNNKNNSNSIFVALHFVYIWPTTCMVQRIGWQEGSKLCNIAILTSQAERGGLVKGDTGEIGLILR